MSGALVRLHYANRTIATRTDVGGAFRLTVTETMRARGRLELHHDAYESSVVRGIVLERGWTDLGRCVVWPLGAATGSVHDVLGRPLRAVTVRAVPIPGCTRTPRRAGPRQARSDDRGNFRITGLPAGSYWITASSPGYADDESPRPHRVAAGQVRDVGDLSLRPAPHVP